MRGGLSPQDACLAVMQRIADHTRDPRLLRDDARPNFQVVLYAVGKDGRFGSASMWTHGDDRRTFAVHANGRNRLEETAYLFDGVPNR